MTSWVKRWIPLLSLAVVPIAQAQSAGAMDTARQATADATRSATPVNDSEEQQIQALRSIALSRCNRRDYSSFSIWRRRTEAMERTGRARVKP